MAYQKVSESKRVKAIIFCLDQWRWDVGLYKKQKYFRGIEETDRERLDKTSTSVKDDSL